MRKLLLMALIAFSALYPFTSSMSTVQEAQAGVTTTNDHTAYLMKQTDELTRHNVYAYLYHLTQDSTKTDLYFRILLNESNLTSELAQKHNNICGMRDWEKNRKYFVGLTSNKYCVYRHWRHSVKDLVDYMDYYGKRAWYFRFKNRLKQINTRLDKAPKVY